MSKRRDVIMAVKALATAALPNAKIRGFDGDTARPTNVTGGGVVIGHPGDPGEPAVDLSPLTYNYDHPITLEFAPGGSDQAGGLDAMMGVFGAAIEADRTLGGLCSWIEAQAPDEDDTPSGTGSQRWAMLDVIASYSTPNPLT
ncbi:hypothetical protein [Sphingomonas sp. PAMC 26605]|uniref:hypothetical protein n=1 Tax=Sphingomonas sp. PAMC 26605 TaxID=1112214 RepID=UPI00026CDCBD|nr:hypothetical protein [Sphingomonas sp. PAMC 26605]